MRITWTTPSKSTALRTYQTTARISPSGINWSCTCPAGEFGRRCWHRLFVSAPEVESYTSEEMKIIQQWRAMGFASVTLSED